MKKIFVVLCFLSVFTSFVYAQNSPNKVQVTEQKYLMGSVFEITLIAKDSLKAHEYIGLATQEIERIENLISEWRDFTPISKVNSLAGIQHFEVPLEVFEITKRALNYSQLTDGAFDISVISMMKIWNFDGSESKMPSKELLQESIKNVGYQNINLDDSIPSIFLKKSGMKIGFGSIGKGYAADKAKQLLVDLGVEAGIVNASGDIAAWGSDIDGDLWNIGIQDPENPSSLLSVIPLKNQSVATSGNYEKYVMVEGKRYGHIINPKTGIPSTDLMSVTVVGPQTEFANFLSTSVMVLGLQKGLELLNNYPSYRYFIVEEGGKIHQNIQFH